jgi:nucleoside-triphosphatase
LGLHVFLQGPRNIGKSTVIFRTLDILTARRPLRLGGFFTWRGGAEDPHIYMRPACKEREREIYRLAFYDASKGGLSCDPPVFEQTGTRLLSANAGAELIIMDELGFLESAAPAFRQAVLATLAGTIPVLGVLRQGDIPWHREIKDCPRVRLYEVNEENREALPLELAEYLTSMIKPAST